MAMYAAAAGLPSPELWGEIGMAESSGRTDIVNGIGAVGVWQILQPTHVKDHPTWTVAWLKSPANNARAAKVLYDADRRAGGNGYRPWEDSRDVWGKTAAAKRAGVGGGGASATAGIGLGNLPIPGIAPLGVDPLGVTDIGSMNPLEGVTEAAGAALDAANWVSNPHNWVRVAMGVIGGALVVGGAVMVAQAATAQKVAPLLQAVPGGGAVKAAAAAGGSAA